MRKNEIRREDMIKFKKLISSFLAFGLISGCLQGIVYAGESAVTWNESAVRGNTTYKTVDGKSYSPKTGTFEGTDGAISYANTDSSYRYYLFGTALPEAAASGRVIVDAEFSDIPSFADAAPLYLFDVADEATGWSSNGKQSELVIRGGSKQIQLTQANALNDSYRERWNTELIKLTAGSGVKLNPNNGVQSLQFIAQSADETSDWTMSVYHKSTSEAAPVYTYTISREDLPDIKYIMNRAQVNSNTTLAMTVNKFKVTQFPAGYGDDFSAEYEPDANDTLDRSVKINVTGTALADVTAVEAYVVNEETGVKTRLDSSDLEYENGAAQISVPTDFYGVLSIDLALTTEGGVFLVNAPLTGDPFKQQYIEGLELESISMGISGEALGVTTDFHELVLKFSNYIDADTLSAVTFTGNGVMNLKKELSEDDKTLTISFDPLIDKEVYTLNIGTELKSQNEFYLSGEITYQYRVDSDLSKLNIVSHNTETKYTLLPGAKRLDIEFNFDVDEKTLDSGISFTNADGTPVPGGYTVAAGENARQAVITFGRLHQGEYKLVTTSALKALDDGISTREAAWSFAVETDDDEPVIYGDFSRYAEGKISATELVNSNTSFANSTYEIETAQDGTKYITTTATQAVKGGGITITLPEPVYKGKIAFDLRFKAVGGSIKRNLFSVKDSSNKKVSMFQINQDNVISKNSESATLNGEFIDNEYVSDEDDDFYNIRVVYMAEDEHSDWTIQVYDKFRSLTEPTWQGKAGREYDSANKKYGLANIAQMVFFDIWWQNGNAESGAGVAVMEYAYHILPVPKVISSDLDTAKPDTNELNLYLDSDLNVNELSEDSVKLMNGDIEIPLVLDYNAQERKLTIIPKEYLEYDTSYEIKFGKMLCENTGFKTPPGQVSISAAPALSGTGESCSLRFSAKNNTSSSARIYTVVRILDAESKLVKVVGNDNMTVEADQSLDAVVPLTGAAIQEGYKIKAFIWAEQNGLIYPITAPVELSG